MSKLVRFIAEGLVEKPDQVSVVLKEDESPTYELRVAQEDLGKVIGKQGRTAKAIRMMMSASLTDDGRARLEIIED